MVMYTLAHMRIYMHVTSHTLAPAHSTYTYTHSRSVSPLYCSYGALFFPAKTGSKCRPRVGLDLEAVSRGKEKLEPYGANKQL